MRFITMVAEELNRYFGLTLVIPFAFALKGLMAKDAPGIWPRVLLARVLGIPDFPRIVSQVFADECLESV
jgi:hypothetical protein